MDTHKCFECGTDLCGPYCPKCNPHIESADTISMLRAELRSAVELLKPFAAHAPKWDWRGADADGNKIGLDGSVVVKSRPGDLSIADFRRAATFIAQHRSWIMADALQELLSDASHHLSDTVSPTWTESTRVAYYERSHELLLRALEMLRKGQDHG